MNLKTQMSKEFCNKLLILKRIAFKKVKTTHLISKKLVKDKLKIHHLKRMIIKSLQVKVMISLTYNTQTESKRISNKSKKISKE